MKENNQCGPQEVAHSYYWINLNNGTHKDFVESNDPFNCLAPNVEYWNYEPSFDGTVGVGAGTLASRPATCTTGVGYWATNQSLTDLTGLIGQNPATPLAGTLSECTSTDTYTDIYTPYIYPHPLRGGGTDAPTEVLAVFLGSYLPLMFLLSEILMLHFTYKVVLRARIRQYHAKLVSEVTLSFKDAALLEIADQRVRVADWVHQQYEYVLRKVI